MSAATDDAVASLSKRLDELEAREAIRTLVIDYSMAVDDRDVVAIGDTFGADGRFAHADGSAENVGREAIVDFYAGRLGAMGPTFHFPHAHKIDFIDDMSATGIVLAHAELSQEGRTYYAGMRYHDRYRKADGRWRFEERLIRFLFFMPMADMVQDGLAQPNRKRFPGQGELATDLPEMQPTWQAFMAEVTS